jgi:hypothetical protein
LTSVSNRPSWTGFRIALDYTDRDLAAHDRIVAGRFGSSSRMLRLLGMVATGFIAAFIGTVLAVAAGSVRKYDGGVIAALIFGGFWLGAWSPAIWWQRHARRVLQARRIAARARWQGAVLFVGPGGIAIRRIGIRLFYARTAITSVTLEQGLVLLWTTTDTAIAIPARLLQPGQQALLVSFGHSGETTLP